MPNTARSLWIPGHNLSSCTSDYALSVHPLSNHFGLRSCKVGYQNRKKKGGIIYQIHYVKHGSAKTVCERRYNMWGISLHTQTQTPSRYITHLNPNPIQIYNSLKPMPHPDTKPHSNQCFIQIQNPTQTSASSNYIPCHIQIYNPAQTHATST